LAKSKFDIIFENDDFVAVNKPSGMLTIPDREQTEKSLKEFLIDKYGSIFVVHRLDKDTSGLVVFAKNETTHKYLCKIFEERKVEKFYLGIVVGEPVEKTGIIDAPITDHLTRKGIMTVHRSGKESQTGYEVLDANPNFSLVSFQLFTGRTHQIRVHTKEIGHPLACDPLYGDGKSIFLSAIKKNYKLSKHDDEERAIINRLALHSYKLNFEDEHGTKMELCAEAPKEFRALMQQLKRKY
jgi:23S rRNA pseudouridine1911/1915/1917 synthase